MDKRYCINSVIYSILVIICKLFGLERELVKKVKYFSIFNKYKYGITEFDCQPFIKKFLPAFFGIICLCIFSFIAVNSIYDKIIYRQLESMKKNGYPTKLSDLYRNIPEDQNAAKPLEVIGRKMTNKLTSIFGDLPEVKLNYLLIADKWDENKNKKAEAIISDFSNTFNEIESILEKHKYYQYVNYLEAEKNPFSIPIPDLKVFRLFCLRGLSNFRNGKVYLLWKDMRTNLKLLNLISQDKGLVPQKASSIIGLTTAETILTAMGEDSKLIPPNDIIDELLRLRKENFIFEGLQTQRAEELARLAKIQENFSFLGKIFYKYNGMTKLNMIASNNYWLKILSLNQSSIKNIESKRKILDKDLKNTPFWPLGFHWAVTYRAGNLYLNEVRDDTYIQILAVATAIRKYKMLNKKYPQKLSELVPKYLTSDLIIDRFSEKELVYKLTKNGFLLYSVGRNFKDDNGTFGYYKPNNDIGILIN